jgi:outer membrane protein assembly factor BamB
MDRFPAGKPTVAWTRNVGFGFGTVSVVGDRLYVMGWRDGKDHVQCLDAAMGEPIWERPYPAERFDKNHRGGPAATPTVDGGLVYTFSKSGVVVCLDSTTGKPRWDRNLAKKYALSVPSWGFSGSVVVWGRMAIVDAGRIVAMDKKTGREIWKTEDYGPAYSTPMPFTHQDRELLATFPAYGLVVVEAGTGKKIAGHKWETSYNVNAATPIVDAGRIFITSGYNHGGALLRLRGKALESLWQNKQMKGKMATPVLLDGHLYGFDESVLRCLDVETGKSVWKKPGLGQGSLMVAGDRLIIMSDDGKLVIAEATAEAFRGLAEAQLFKVNEGWIMPVLAHGRIYCRSSDGQLVCVDVRKSGT